MAERPGSGGEWGRWEVRIVFVPCWFRLSGVQPSLLLTHFLSAGKQSTQASHKLLFVLCYA
jgi:hypothetical protein